MTNLEWGLIFDAWQLVALALIFVAIITIPRWPR